MLNGISSALPPAAQTEIIVALVTVIFILPVSGLLSGLFDILLDLLRRKLKLTKPTKNNEE